MKRYLYGAVLLTVMAQAVPAAEAAALGPDPKEVQAVADRAADYLKTSQGKDGSFSPQRAGPG